MRRATSISLIMLFSFALIWPLLAPDAQAQLPACCRRNGKHHCMMGTMRGSSANGSTTISARCPCFPAGSCAVHSAAYKPETARQFYVEVVSKPARPAQTETLCRIAFLRSHQKRGPPALFA
jgi:hypothetical protein